MGQNVLQMGQILQIRAIIINWGITHKVKPLHIMLPKTTAYVKSYDGQTKWMYFLVEDNDLLERINRNKLIRNKERIW